MLLRQLLALTESEQLYVIEVPFIGVMPSEPMDLHALHADPSVLTQLPLDNSTKLKRNIARLNKTELGDVNPQELTAIKFFEKSGEIWQQVVGTLDNLHEFIHYYVEHKYNARDLARAGSPTWSARHNDSAAYEEMLDKIFAKQQAEEQHLSHQIKPYKGDL